MNNDQLPVLYDKKENCCGCFACYSVCTVNAIAMVEDEEGFLYPVIDEDKCIKCLKCVSSCAFQKDQRERRLK